MHFPIVLVSFSRQRQLEVRAVVSVEGLNEQVGYEVNGVRFSVKC